MEEYQVTEDESKLNGEKIKVLEPSKVLIVSIVVVLFREYPLKELEVSTRVSRTSPSNQNLN